MNDPLLTSAETDALLDAMRSTSDESNVESADLGSPDRPLRQALGRADHCVQQMSPELRKAILRIANCSSTSEEQPAEIVPFTVFTNAILPGSCIATIRTHDDCSGLIVISPQLCNFILERRLGAPLGEGASRALTRPELSSLDRRILKPLLLAMCTELGRAWNGNVEDFQLVKILKNANEMPALTQFEPLLRIGLRVVPAGGAGDEVVFALTAGAVRATTPQEPTTKVLAISPDERAKMALRLSSAEVDLIAALGKAHITVGRLLDLTVGDVVRLDRIPNEPIELQVEGLTKLLGLPVVQHGNLAIEVTQTR